MPTTFHYLLAVSHKDFVLSIITSSLCICSIKKLLLKTQQNLQESNCAGVSFSIKLWTFSVQLYKQDTLGWRLSDEFCKFFKSNFRLQSNLSFEKEHRVLEEVTCKCYLSNHQQFIKYESISHCYSSFILLLHRMFQKYALIFNDNKGVFTYFIIRIFSFIP